MEKRYQVFISSTFRDLLQERQAVLKAVLELDHMPAGMELFPASDDAAWQLITDVIDASDYYVVIIGGRYGSLDDAGIGYTEREYDYAVSLKKPVIPLLHQNPDNLPRDKTETETEAWKKLKTFRAKVEKNHTCVYWTTADDLKARVIVGLTSAIKRHPATGWVRADQVPSDSTVAEILKLRNRVVELEQRAQEAKTSPPDGTEELSQGDDEFTVHFTFSAGPVYDRTSYNAQLSFTWNQIFGAVAPAMINECSDVSLRVSLTQFLEREAKNAFQDDDDLKKKALLGFEFRDDEIDTCRVQLRALGLIRESVRARSVKDTGTYWTLSPYGDYLMTQLRALRRKPEHRPTKGAEVTPK